MSLAPYYLRGSTAQHTDTKSVRWARRLLAFQQASGGASKYNPAKNDTPHRTLVKLTSSVNNGWTTVTAGVDSGPGIPSGVAIGKKKVYIQENSLPPDRLWVYYNGAWT
jgi:hypothetical protein